jgi:tRNA pseudouridine55 synthase
VRSLVRDLGDALDCGAHVTALRRLWVDPFRSPEMVTLAELEACSVDGVEALDRLLLPIEAGLAAYPEVVLDEAQGLRLRQGQPVQLGGDPGICLARSSEGRLLALAERGADGLLRTLRGFNLG